MMFKFALAATLAALVAGQNIAMPTVKASNGEIHIHAQGVQFVTTSLLAAQIAAKRIQLSDASGDTDLATKIIAEIAALELEATNAKPPITIHGIDSHLTSLDDELASLTESTTTNLASAVVTLRDNVLGQLKELKEDSEEKDTDIQNTMDTKVLALEGKIASLREDLTTTKADLDGVNNAQDVRTSRELGEQNLALKKDYNAKLSAMQVTVSKHTKDIVNNKAAHETAIAAFQMPEISWSQKGSNGLITTTCKSSDKGKLRRVKGSAPADIHRVVYCNGKNWNTIAPTLGPATDIRLPGGGCKMNDVHSYRTGSSGCRYIHFKTNIKVKSSVMYKIRLEGYNYGKSRHFNNVAVGYTYSGWSCRGADHHYNFGGGSDIDTYCSGGYIVVRAYQSSSYYIGMTVSAEFLNPTGDSMCGKFAITKTVCSRSSQI